MGIAILVGIIILLFIYFLAQDSRKETKKERYGEAIGALASMAADSVSGMAFKLTEPADKKKIRLAREKLADRNASLYRFEDYSEEEYLKSQFEIKEDFKNVLTVLGLSEDRWRKLAENLFYIGILKRESREISDYSKKNTKSMRVHILYDWEKKEGILSYTSKYLFKALRHFNIKEEEWIEYGDTVVDMYNLMDLPDMEKFGVITAIKPMHNNMHLL